MRLFILKGETLLLIDDDGSWDEGLAILKECVVIFFLLFPW
jgi:hypothetical protein